MDVFVLALAATTAWVGVAAVVQKRTVRRRGGGRDRRADLPR